MPADKTCVPKAPYQLETYTGLYVQPPELKPEEIDIHDIAHALSQMARHGGHCLKRMSVAQHCCLVHDYLVSKGVPPEGCFQGLMHDAEEAYLVDIPRPVKYRPEMESYRNWGKELRRRIYDRFGIEPTRWERLVKAADNAILIAEIRQWKRSKGCYMDKGVIGAPVRIIPWTDSKAEWCFLMRFWGYREEGLVAALPVGEQDES